MKLNKSSVRKGLRFCTELPMAGNYTYPELTPTRNTTTHASFPFYVWLGQFVMKIPETGAVGHSKITRKYRFLAIGEIRG